MRVGPAIRSWTTDYLFQAKVGVMLLSVFGMLALALASVGLYGIIAYPVHQEWYSASGRHSSLAAGQNVVRCQWERPAERGRSIHPVAGNRVYCVLCAGASRPAVSIH
jgi:hypothetical protein